MGRIFIILFTILLYYTSGNIAHANNGLVEYENNRAGFSYKSISPCGFKKPIYINSQHDSARNARIVTTISENSYLDLESIPDSDDHDDLYTSINLGPDGAERIWGYIMAWKAIPMALILGSAFVSGYKTCKKFVHDPVKTSYEKTCGIARAKKCKEKCRWWIPFSSCKRKCNRMKVREGKPGYGWCQVQKKALRALKVVNLFCAPVIGVPKVLLKPYTWHWAFGVFITPIIINEVKELLKRQEICRNAYVLKPHEVVNLKLGSVKLESDSETNEVRMVAISSDSEVYTEDDIPYFYHCDPNWDPMSGTAIGNNNDNSYKIGSTLGYMGHNPDMCNSEMKRMIEEVGMKDMIKKVYVQYNPTGKFSSTDETDDPLRELGDKINSVPILNAIISALITPTRTNDSGLGSSCLNSASESYNNDSQNCRNTIALTLEGGENRGILGDALQLGGWTYFVSLFSSGGIGNIASAVESLASGDTSGFVENLRSPIRVKAYYKNDKGTIKKCVVTTSWTDTPIKIGCIPMAPPGSVRKENPYLSQYVGGTRCKYFVTGREDLRSLGALLPQTDSPGKDGTSVKRFLESDMHIVSTVVGCIRDVLTKMFINQNRYSEFGGKSFFMVVQERLRSIIMAVLVLYICIVGIRIISSPQPLKRSDFLMMIIKFGIVFYFSLGSAWYEVRGDKVYGLYPKVVSFADEIASLYMESQERSDPIGMCSYDFAGRNILSERTIHKSSFDGDIKSTHGTRDHIKMTVWDLIDCKIINYLTFGSCNYSIKGMLISWFINYGLSLGILGLAVTLIGIIYMHMLFLILFKFIHIVILSTFVVTILVLVSPLFIMFWLFKQTEQMAQRWFTNLISYSLYPGLLFAFIALMLASFDGVVYGPINIDFSASVSHVDRMKNMCEGVDSVFCIFLDSKNYDVCGKGGMSTALNSMLTVCGDDSFWCKISNNVVFRQAAALAYFVPLFKLMGMALLFYLMMDAVASILALLMGVDTSLTRMAKGQINTLNIAGSIAGKTTGTLAKKGGQAAKAGAKKMSGGGKQSRGGGAQGGSSGGS